MERHGLEHENQAQYLGYGADFLEASLVCGTMFHYVSFNLHPFYELNENLKYYRKKSEAKASFVITGNNTFKKGQTSRIYIIEWNYDRYMPSALYFVLLPCLLGFLYCLFLAIFGKVRLYPRRRKL